jgi:hypothetical protein
MLKTLTIIALACAALAGCTKAAETSSAAGLDFKVDRLFTHEGCTAYRFADEGRFRYYTRCDGAQAATTWSEYCGKNCTRSVDVPTYTIGRAE